MFGYTFRLDFTDGTSDVLTVDATSIPEALELLGTADDRVATTLLGTINRQPQKFLAW